MDVNWEWEARTIQIAVNMAVAHQHSCARHGYHSNEAL